jgi:hypothetical protein
MRTPSFLALVFVAVAALFLAGCERITEADKAVAVEVVKANLEAMKKRDIEALTATVHPNSPYFEESKAFAQQQAERYTLLYDLKSAEFDSTKGDTIRVRFVQETRKLMGPPELQDNRVTGVHVLRRDREKWKLWSTEIIETAPLGPPTP